MNKKIFGVIFAVIFVSLPLKSVFAEVNIVPVIVEPTTVTLLINGHLTKSCYDFILYDLKDSVAINHPQVQKKEVCRKVADDNFAEEDNNYRVTFSSLKPGNEYMVEFKELDSKYSNKFMTAYNDSDLNGIIKIVSDRLDGSIIEGTSVGQYIVGSKAKLQTALTDAEHINGDIKIYTQSDIDVAARDLQNALNTFELSKVGSTTSSSTTTSTTTPKEEEKEKGIVPRCNVGPIDQATGNYINACDFNYFMRLINNIIKFLLFVIATPLVALIIVYVAYLFLTAGGSAGQTEKAKHILFNVVIGYVIALSAWLIINTIMSTLKVDPEINMFMSGIEEK